MDFSAESSKARLLATLRSKSSWAEILPESTDMRLIEMVADEIQELARYGEFLSRENRWLLAQKKSSLMKQVRAKGYRPHRKIGAVGEVVVSVSDDAFAASWKWYLTYAIDDLVSYDSKIWKALAISSNVTPVEGASWTRIRTIPDTLIGIPKYTEFSGSNRLSYTSIAAVNYTTMDDYVSVEVVQGVKKSVQYTAEGLVFEEFDLADSSIDNVYFELYVDDELWTEIDDIRKAELDEKRYQIIDDYDFSGIRIRFGNSTVGKKLTAGQIVKFIYISTDGASGSITTLGGITSINSTITDYLGNQATLFASNFNSIIGGKDHETLEEIRTNAAKYFQSGEQIISKADYESYLLDNFSFIGNCVVWGAYEQNLDDGHDPWDYVPTEENLVYVSAFSPGDTPVDILKNSDGTENSVYKLKIIQGIREKKPITDILKFVNVQFVYFGFSTTLYVSDQNYLLSEVRESVRAALLEEYPITKMTFKKNLYETNYKRFIDEQDGVEHHDTVIKFYNFSSFQSGGGGASYRSDFVLPMFPLKPSSVKIYVMDTYAEAPVWTQVAHDDGLGDLTADAGFTLDAISDIDYSNGVVTLSINTGLSETYPRYSIKTVYEITSLNLVLSARNQILYLYDVSDISAEYIES